MTQMVWDLKLEGLTEGAFREYLVDTRGVFGPVHIRCLAKDACNGMTILFQKEQDYGYQNGWIGQHRTLITLECVADACDDVRLNQLNNLPQLSNRRRPWDITGFVMKDTTVKMMGVELAPVEPIEESQREKAEKKKLWMEFMGNTKYVKTKTKKPTYEMELWPEFGKKIWKFKGMYLLGEVMDGVKDGKSLP